MATITIRLLDNKRVQLVSADQYIISGESNVSEVVVKTNYSTDFYVELVNSNKQYYKSSAISVTDGQFTFSIPSGYVVAGYLQLYIYTIDSNKEIRWERLDLKVESTDPSYDATLPQYYYSSTEIDSLLSAKADSSDLTSLQTTITELEARVTTLESTIGDINTILDDINGEVI